MRTDIFPQITYQNNLDKAGRVQSAAQRKDELRQAALEFEALFLEQMMKEMRQSLPEDQLIPTEPIFVEMLDGELVRKVIENGGIGMAKLVEDSFND